MLLTLTVDELRDALHHFHGRRPPRTSVAWWATNGWLVPSARWARVRRVAKLYSVDDLARARLILLCTEARLGTIAIHKILTHLEQFEPDVLTRHTNAVLVVDRRTRQVLVTRPGKGTRTVPPTGQMLLPFEVRLAEVVEGNRAYVERLRRAA